MGQTTKLALRYPALTDAPNGPQQLQNLAEDVEAKLGLIICTSATRPASPYQGMTIYETDTLKVQFWNGTAWKELRQVATEPKIDSGSIAVSRSASTVGTANVTFTTAFTSTPIVVATINGAAGSTSGSIVRVTSITTTGCQIVLNDVNGTVQTDSASVAWIARQ